MKAGILLALAVAAFPSPSAAQPPKKTLDIGLVLRLNDKFNGQFNETVTAMADGVEAAKAMYEKAHPEVRVILHRYPHGPGMDSVAAAADLALKDKVPAVIGGELSEEAFVLRDKLGPHQVVFITPTASHPAVTEGHSYSFRACFSDRQVAERLAGFTLDHVKARRVGLVRNVSSPYTDFLASQFAASLKHRVAKAGLKATLTEIEVLRETMDFEPAIKRFKRGGVTHVVMPSYQNDLLRFVLQAAESGFFPVYIGSDGWGSSEQVHEKLVKDSPFGSRFVAFRNAYSRDEPGSAIAREFQEAYAAVTKRRPTAAAAVAFDAAWALMTAMDRAAEPGRGRSIRDALRALKDLPLVTTERFSLDANNSPAKELFIYRIDKDGVRYEVTLK